MEPNESGLSSYYHNHHQQQQQQATSSVPSPNNGLLPNNTPTTSMVFPHSVVPSVPVEAVRRKRGRPRKYGTPEQAAAAKRLSAAASTAAATKKDHHAFVGGATSLASSAKKSQLAALGSAGHGFTPHIISVAAGEDVGQKIMLFMQQSKREICILSASGSISNASLRQPATSGGSITYEGRFDIISLTGSYVRTELGGKTGGLSVCLSSTDGQIIGGGVGGPLTAAGPIQVIIGAFLFDTKRDIVVDVKTNTVANKLPSAVGAVPVSNAAYRPTVDSLGSRFMIQSRGMQMTRSQSNDWGVTDTRSNAAGYDFSGRIASGAHESPENGNYDHISDRD